MHHTGPPLGLSRDLIIRGLADKLQQRAHGGPSRALQRRLRTLAAEFEKGARSFDPDIVLKTGATLVRQWRGHTHTVLAREDGFEYEGERYRSLTVIAERITGAHWSGPGSLVSPNGRVPSSRRGRTMKKPGTTTRRNGTVRCAIYTRKSSEEGLEQEFNSLQAQREACEAFIDSQRHEGWVGQRAAYDDGGFSGATMDRPALQRLLADVKAGRVDTIVVYKIDRLTRSLADFAKIGPKFRLTDLGTSLVKNKSNFTAPPAGAGEIQRILSVCLPRGADRWFVEITIVTRGVIGLRRRRLSSGAVAQSR